MLSKEEGYDRKSGCSAIRRDVIGQVAQQLGRDKWLENREGYESKKTER